MHNIHYYNKDGSRISSFTGDADTLANAMFHLNFYNQLPDMIITKVKNAKEHRLYMIEGGFQWVRVKLGKPFEEIPDA